MIEALGDTEEEEEEEKKEERRTRYEEEQVKIQGDGRKFLDRFKSYFGLQISSQSLNEVCIYQLQPEIRNKRCFFIYFCLCFELASWIANGERSRQVLLGKRPR